LGNSIKDVLFIEFRNSLESKRAWSLRGLRALARSGYGAASEELFKLTGKEVAQQPCHICGGALFNKIDHIVSLMHSDVSDYDFQSFQVGSSLPRKMLRSDDELKIKHKLAHGENIKTEFNRLVSNAFSERAGKTHSFQEPDLMIMVEPISGRVRVSPAPVYVYGRYRKLQRGISQTRKAGADPLKSIEGMLASILVPLFSAKGMKFHGAGREDVDAMMLGSGRPFIAEVLDPKRRAINPDEIAEQFNKEYGRMVEILDLKPATKMSIAELKLKGEKTSKLYHVIVKVPNLPSDDRLIELEQKTKGLIINQRTPRRISWRRADKIRRRTISWLKVKPIPPQRLDVTIEAQAGTYIKEFVTGDEGRTKPSLAELLNMPAEWESLEVLEIIGD